MNPFSPTKFELEKRPIIWLSQFSTDIKRDKKSVFIGGSRGSGKTTILRSLSLQTIMSDESLFQQHGSRKIHWIGQYLKFNTNFQEYMEILDAALTGKFDSELLSERLFCAYLELSILKFFLDDVLKLQRGGNLHLHGAMEVHACNELAHILGHCTWTSIENLADFHDARRLTDVILEKFFEFRTDRDLEPLTQFIDKFKPTSLLLFIKNFAIHTLKSSRIAAAGELEFFVLLDDCENLSEKQQIALNSYLRRTEGEIKWVLCYLNHRYNISETNLRNTSLTTDDRSLLLLNEMEEQDFKTFCEKVTNSRIERYIEDLRHGHISEKHSPFTLSGKFGEKISYNSRISSLMEKSDSTSWVDFKKDVEATKGKLVRTIKKSLHPQFGIVAPGSLPYVEHVVMEAFSIEPERYSSEREQKSLHNTIRGKQGSAYIAICAKYFSSPHYAGSEYVLAVSDRCIRDYLDLMSGFFEHFSGPERGRFDPEQRFRAALKFWRSETFGLELQDEIIKQHSKSKMGDLSLSRKTRTKVNNFVHGFGELQACIARDYRDGRAVRELKRGRFKIHMPSLASEAGVELSEVVDLFQELEYDRYIKIHAKADAVDEGFIYVSLHRRMRPYFRCGHLAPTGRSIELAPKRLAELFDENSNLEARKWAGSLYASIRSNPDDNQLQMEL
jgi:energy-coupling factor transporter ATP-binding protein EcfA2